MIAIEDFGAGRLIVVIFIWIKTKFFNNKFPVLIIDSSFHFNFENPKVGQYVLKSNS